MGDTTTEVDAHEQIREVLVDRMGEYFRPGYSGTWLLNSANLALVVGDIVAAELDRLASQIESEAAGTDGGFVDGVGVAVQILESHASELRGEGKDGDG